MLGYSMNEESPSKTERKDSDEKKNPSIRFLA